MHESKEGRAILARGRLTRFAPALDGDDDADPRDRGFSRENLLIDICDTAYRSV
jgi:hypothetical protein